MNYDLLKRRISLKVVFEERRIPPIAYSVVKDKLYSREIKVWPPSTIRFGFFEGNG